MKDGAGLDKKQSAWAGIAGFALPAEPVLAGARHAELEAAVHAFADAEGASGPHECVAFPLNSTTVRNGRFGAALSLLSSVHGEEVALLEAQVKALTRALADSRSGWPQAQNGFKGDCNGSSCYVNGDADGHKVVSDAKDDAKLVVDETYVLSPHPSTRLVCQDGKIAPKCNPDQTVPLLEARSDDIGEARVKYVPAFQGDGDGSLIFLDDPTLGDIDVEMQHMLSQPHSFADTWEKLVVHLLDHARVKFLEIHSPFKQSSAFVNRHLKTLDEDTKRRVSRKSVKTALMRRSRAGLDGMLHLGAMVQNQHFSEQALQCIESYVLEPHGTKRISWILAGMFLILFDMVVIPMQAFGIEKGTALNIISWVTQIFWTLDIFVSFMSGITSDSESEMRLRAIASHYIRGWFFIDLVITMPVWLALILQADAGEESRTLKVAKVFRMFRFLRMLRLAKLDKLLNETLDGVNSSAVLLFIGVLKLILALAMISHLNACVWYQIGKTRHVDGREGWAYNQVILSGSTAYKYLSSMHWSLTQFQGTSDMLPGQTTEERGYAVGMVMLALLLLSSFVSSLTNMMMNFQATFSKLTYREEVVRGYLYANHVTGPLAVRIKKYVSWKQRLEKKQEFDLEIVNILPRSLLMDMLHDVRTPQLSVYAFFRIVEQEYCRFLRRVTFECAEVFWPHPGELIFGVGDEGKHMYFVRQGELLYTILRKSKRKENDYKESLIQDEDIAVSRNVESSTGKVGSGCVVQRIVVTKHLYLSEGALWTVWDHRGDCVTTPHLTRATSVLYLLVGEFIKIIQCCPPVHALAVKHARRFAANANRFGSNVSDWIEPGSMDLQREESHCTDDDDDEDD